MIAHSFPYRLYLVISEESCLGRNMYRVAEEAIRGGVDIVQLREKTASVKEFTEKARKLREVLDRYKVPLIINDNLEVAREVDAFGIHVGNKDMPPTRVRELWSKQTCVGYSIEYLTQLANNETRVSDYLGLSPVFNTRTKTDTVTEWGISGVHLIRQLTDKPLVAIGNMNAANAREVMRAGADCIAVVSAICGAENPGRAAEIIRSQIENAL